VLATYVSALLVCGASLVIGQAALSGCGWRRWSWLAPGVGLGLVLALAWATVRLPGEGTTSAAVIGALAAVSIAALWRGGVAGIRAAVGEGPPPALIALAASSLPFAVEGHFGVLGTSFNPDMGQQLFAADWLVDPNRREPGLVENGYPLGPHAVAAALTAVTGANLVTAFDGLTIAVPVLAALTSLTVLRELPPVRQALGAALVALPYMAASYVAQGLFKELIQALLVLAFALCLHELARAPDPSDPVRGTSLATAERWRRLFRAVPLGLIAIGSVYAYSAPGLVWLGAAAALFAAVEIARARWAGRDVGAVIRRAAGPAAVALAVLVIAAAAETGRMVEFRGTAVDVARAEVPDERGEPRGSAGGGRGRPAPVTGPVGGEDEGEVQFNNRLGNLLNEISPLEALGVWPTGDFRLDAGAGAAPAIAFYACAALGGVALLLGLARWIRRGETAVPAALAASSAIYLAAWIAGTPYTAAKAVLMIAPLATLVPVRELLAPRDGPHRLVGALSIRSPYLLAIGAAFALGAGASSLLALVNAPVGPREYSAGLFELRSRVVDGGVLVLVPPMQLAEEHAEQFVAWELRGIRGLRVEPGGGQTLTGEPPAGIEHVITGRAGPSPPYEGAFLEKRRDPYRLWRLPRGH
jgi:hypothetical protein